MSKIKEICNKISQVIISVLAILLVVAMVMFLAAALHGMFLLFDGDFSWWLLAVPLTVILLFFTAYKGMDNEDDQEEIIEASAYEIFTASAEKTSEVADLQEAVNFFAKKHPNSVTIWLQSSSSSMTTLTAVVEYTPEVVEEEHNNEV